VFIDPACKGGEFLREVYDRLMETESLKALYTTTLSRSIHILQNQIYGIALSEVSKVRTENLLDGYVGNIKVIPDYINKLKGISKDKDKKIIADIINKEFGREIIKTGKETEEMRFTVVIGNPPYQESTDGGLNGGKAIYDKFIYNAMRLADITCMIVKNNWMNSDSLKELRETILASGLKTLINYSLLGDVFPTMGIAASIINIDKEYAENPDYKLDYSEVRKNKIINKYSADIRGLGFIPESIFEYEIVKKVQAKTTKSFKEHVIGLSPFGINTNGALINSKGKFVDESEIQTDDYDILIKYDKDTKYTNINSFTKNTNLVNKYKLICPKQIHKNNNPIPKVIGLKPNEICSASFSLMYCDDNGEIAVNVYKYIKTRFFRFLVYCLADSLCGLNSYRVSLVPDQDFTNTSDIDWTQSISNIDNQLYKKYNLSQEETNYIKSTIKPMDDNPQKTKYTKEDLSANYVQKMIQASTNPQQ
jgi:hypothetical protein